MPFVKHDPRTDREEFAASQDTDGGMKHGGADPV
jgi:hypothetical protein